MNGVANGVYGGDLPNQINTPWIDFSEQSTIVGWSSFTLKSIRYKLFGKTLIVFFNITGTSNSTTTSFTLPYNVGNLFTGAAAANNVMRVTNNGSPFLGYGTVPAGSNVLTFSFFSTYAAFGTWTASGTKALFGQYIFEID